MLSWMRREVLRRGGGREEQCQADGSGLNSKVSERPPGVGPSGHRVRDHH